MKNCCCKWGAAISGEWPEFECETALSTTVRSARPITGVGATGRWSTTPEATTMPEPTPLTDEELTSTHNWRNWPGEPADTGVLVDRLLATVDVWRARAEQAEAERDALRAAMREALDPATTIADAWRALAEHVGWHDDPTDTPATESPHDSFGLSIVKPDTATEPCPTCLGMRTVSLAYDGIWPCPDCSPATADRQDQP